NRRWRLRLSGWIGVGLLLPVRRLECDILQRLSELGPQIRRPLRCRTNQGQVFNINSSHQRLLPLTGKCRAGRNVATTRRSSKHPVGLEPTGIPPAPMLQLASGWPPCVFVAVTVTSSPLLTVSV